MNNNENIIRVMGFGTFDGLHPGHISFLNQLRQLGDELIIAISLDKNVENIKGKKPILNQSDRLIAVKNTNIPTKVVLGHEFDFYYSIKEFNPHIIGLGYDQNANITEINTLFPHIEIVRLLSHEPKKYKSSLLNQTSNRHQIDIK